MSTDTRIPTLKKLDSEWDFSKNQTEITVLSEQNYSDPGSIPLQTVAFEFPSTTSRVVSTGTDS